MTDLDPRNMGLDHDPETIEELRFVADHLATAWFAKAEQFSAMARAYRDAAREMHNILRIPVDYHDISILLNTEKKGPRSSENE